MYSVSIIISCVCVSYVVLKVAYNCRGRPVNQKTDGAKTGYVEPDILIYI